MTHPEGKRPLTVPSQTLRSVGLMSGTSMDGIDAALLETDGESTVKDLAAASLRYDPEFKTLMKATERAVYEADGDVTVAERDYAGALQRYITETRKLSDADSQKETANLAKYLYGTARHIDLRDVVERSTRLHATVVKNLIKKAGFAPREIDLIGYHGQTLFHRPSMRRTIQAGDGQLLANEAEIAVVYDFRSADVAAGGQGAPFAPLYHAALARQMGLTPVVVANCGGIANITVITEDDESLFAFDTGPGNGLVDRFVLNRAGQPCDLDGKFGLRGTVNPAVLGALRQHGVSVKSSGNFLDAKPPKSLDVNDLVLVPELESLSLEDGCATLERFTVECIVESLRFVTERGTEIPRLWIVAGGGWQNAVIFNELSRLLSEKYGSSMKVRHADAVGWSGTALEAQIFAYLAVRSVRGLPLSVPGTTGVHAPTTGGRIALPHSDEARASQALRSLIRKA